MAAAAAVLREDDRGFPRSLPLLAALVEAAARHCTYAASQPAETDLVRAFRGGAAPKVPIHVFLGRIHLLTSMASIVGMIRIDGTCFVLAGVYLNRFIGSPAGREAGILVDPATAHRLVAVAVFLGAKFGDHPPRRWAAVFEASSEGVIRAGEMADLEGRFLRAIDFRLFVDGEGFKSFCQVLEQGHPAASGGGGGACKKRLADVAARQEDERPRSPAALCRPVQLGFGFAALHSIRLLLLLVLVTFDCLSIFCYRCKAASRRTWLGWRRWKPAADQQPGAGVESTNLRVV